MKVHLDTDFGGDPDDACALAFLLGTPNVEVVGITTNLDAGGYRAGCVRYYLELAGRGDVPVVAGAGTTLTDNREYDSTAHDQRYWPQVIAPIKSAAGEALDLLVQSIEGGATVIAVGAATNLALLEMQRPGSLARARIVFMGGWTKPPADGLPQWGPERDWNVQCDPRAAAMLEYSGDLILVTLPATLEVFLRRADLRRLKQSGSVGRLLARQSELYARVHGFHSLAREYPGSSCGSVEFPVRPSDRGCGNGLVWRGH